MQLRESIEKTQIFFQETLKSLILMYRKNILKKPSISSSFNNPFSSCTFNCKNPDDHIADLEYYTNFCNQLESDLDKLDTTTTKVGSWAQHLSSRTKPVNSGFEVTPVSLSVRNPPSHTTTTTTIPKESTLTTREGDHIHMKKKRKKKKGTIGNEVSSYVLAKKIKELEMVDVSDVEHVLDVEEALHYYSRLKSPAYLDIVDKFFTDMYQELSSESISSSSCSGRKLASFRF
ncbi:hypothetical protein LINPERHAP1_LOCUS34803 [Linum perenne]